MVEQGPGLRKLIIVAVVSAVAGGITTYVVQSQLHERQIAAEVEVRGKEKQKELIAKLAGDHEHFMDANVKFLFASEFEAMKNAFDIMARFNGGTPNPRVSEAFDKQIKALGLAPAGAVFSDMSDGYSEASNNLVVRLTEVDLYFSDRVTQHARAYRNHMASGKPFRNVLSRFSPLYTAQ